MKSNILSKGPKIAFKPLSLPQMSKTISVLQITKKTASEIRRNFRQSKTKSLKAILNNIIKANLFSFVFF